MNKILTEYNNLLESSISPDLFHEKMVELTVEFPYFFSPYVEILNYLESKNLEQEKKLLLLFTFKKIQELTQYTVLQKEFIKHFSKNEINSILQLLKKYKEDIGGNIFFSLRTIKNIGNKLPALQLSEKNIFKINNCSDIQIIKDEVNAYETLWTLNTKRQENIIFHQDTNAIVLRYLPNFSKEFTPVDGKHESLRSSFGNLFPKTIGLIEEFASEKNGGLGRVAFVRLKPKSKVFRHFDGEEHLIGRNRYHLVVQSKDGSLMTSGSEKKLFHEGDLFFFNNHVMHTAENNSDDWRIHIIFDMKLLDSK